MSDFLNRIQRGEFEPKTPFIEMPSATAVVHLNPEAIDAIRELARVYDAERTRLISEYRAGLIEDCGFKGYAQAEGLLDFCVRFSVPCESTVARQLRIYEMMHELADNILGEERA